MEIVAFEEKSAVIYGEIRANLEKQGIVIGGMDMLIAAQAIALGSILITNNVNEFSRIPNLVLENCVK